MNYYFHFPFCRSKCGYCAFYSLPTPSEEAIARWLERILRELKEFEPVETCETIYLGGGTPTLPEPRMLERFFRSPWFETLCDLDGRGLIGELRREVGA